MFWSMSISSRGFLRWTSPLLSHGKHPLHTCQSTLTMIHVIKVFVCLLQWCSTWYSDQVQPSCGPAVANWYRKSFHVLFSYLCVTCSTVERTKPAMWVWQTPVYLFFFLLQSPCAGIVVQDPYTGEIQGQEKATRQQSRTVRSHLLQFKSYTITIFSPSIFPLSSPSIFPLSSPSISPSPLPPSPPLLSEKAFLWWVECRTGGHSEGVERRICQKRRLCKNISYWRLLGALWVREKWGYHQLSCPRNLVLLMSMTVW